MLAGQGSALAMAAAYILAGELASAEGDHVRPFAYYEQRLRNFMEQKQRSAEQFASYFEPKFQEADALRDGLARVKVNGKVGFINKIGSLCHRAGARQRSVVRARSRLNFGLPRPHLWRHR